jgi:hypothetical protein
MVTQYRRHQADCKYSNKKKYPEPRKHNEMASFMDLETAVKYITVVAGAVIVFLGCAFGVRAFGDARHGGELGERTAQLE